jgi:glutathione S-transferase
MAIAVSGIRVELREVVLRDKPTELVEASAKATVPVLMLPDGEVIDESLDIMHWALRQNDPENWLAADDTGLIEQNDGPFKAALDRYKYPHRYGLEDGTTHREDGVAILRQLDAGLRKCSFLAGDACGLTDIAIFPFIRQFAATDQTWFDDQPLPALQGWLGHLLASDLFASIMHRYPRWQAGDQPTVFP